MADPFEQSFKVHRAAARIAEGRRGEKRAGKSENLSLSSSGMRLNSY
jgi:hypothetical protein